MAARKPTRLETGFLVLFHAALSGSLVVAYLTGDEDTYAMHLFAGYTVLAALGLRLAAALLAPAGSPLAWPRPALAATRAWLARIAAGDRAAMRARSPLYAWFAVIMLGFAAAAGVTGWVSDGLPFLGFLHEGIANLAPAIIVAHIAAAFGLHVLRQRGQATLPAAQPATAR